MICTPKRNDEYPRHLHMEVILTHRGRKGGLNPNNQFVRLCTSKGCILLATEAQSSRNQKRRVIQCSERQTDGVGS